MADLTHIHFDPEKLKAARKSARKSQSEAGHAAGVGKAAISKYECGLAFPSAEVLARLCAFYEVEISALTTESELAPAV
jgi:transcriptional regulator with XRE-family HTH domain